jgi:hypothetical protein
MSSTKPECVYAVFSFTRSGKRGGLVGIFTDKNEMVNQITSSGPHEVWEYAYSIVVAEKVYLNCFQHPVDVIGEDSELLWFEWVCDEPFEKTQTGKYVVMTKCPEWADGSFGFG